MAEYSGVVRKASSLCRIVVKKLHESGVIETFKLVALKLISKMHNLASVQGKKLHPFDLKYGTDTSGIVESWALDIPDDMVTHAVRYQTGMVDVVIEILNSLTIPYEEFVFVDIGSGKGRTLLLASQFPYKEIIGVELAANLHRIANHNIQIYKDELQQCHRIKSVCINAINYEMPRENIVFYFFNPFDEKVMREVMSNIENSFQISPRKMHILYLKPLYRHVFDSAKFLRVAKETNRYVVFESKPVVSL